LLRLCSTNTTPFIDAALFELSRGYVPRFSTSIQSTSPVPTPVHIPLFQHLCIVNLLQHLRTVDLFQHPHPAGDLFQHPHNSILKFLILLFSF
jgi:hypothetical protein